MGLVPNPVPATPYVPPTNKDLDILFQPMFDEYLEPPRVKRPGSPAQAVQALVISAGTPSSTTIDQDAPSPRKSKKHTHKPKTKNTNLEVLNTLHMDLCGSMRVQTINGKKYILVIVDDYSRFTWVIFLRSKYETPEVVIKFIQQIQVGLNKTVRYIRTDNDTEFVNQTLTEYYERIGIFHQKTVPRTPQQNDVVERRNRTLVKAARTMLIFSKAPITGPTPNILTPGHISLGLVPNPVPATPYVPPTNKDLDILFQPMFDEYLEPPRVKRPGSPAQAVQALVISAGTPSPPLIKMHLLLVFHSHPRLYNLNKALQLNLLSWKTILLLPLTIISS
nr:ribonuclease H-like domain-containing protein [Tanacetum cinerariifolium]